MSEQQAPRPMDGYYSPWRASMGQSGSIYATVDGGEAFVNEVTREGEAPILKDAVFVAKVTKWMRDGPSTGTILNARPCANEPCFCGDIPDCGECTMLAMDTAVRRWAKPQSGVNSADRRIIAWMPVDYMEAARAGAGGPDALDVARDFTGFKVGDVMEAKAGQVVLTWPGDMIAATLAPMAAPPMLDCECGEPLFPAIRCGCNGGQRPCRCGGAYRAGDGWVWSDTACGMCPECGQFSRVVVTDAGVWVQEERIDAHEAAPVAPCDPWLISPASLPAALRNGPENGKGKARARMVYDFEEVP